MTTASRQDEPPSTWKMPPPNSIQSGASGPWALEVANANNALNTFLGARQPTWLSSSAGPSRLPHARTATNAGSTHIRQRPNNVNTTSGRSLLQVFQDGDQGSSTIPILPSSPPTDGMSPATSLGLGSPVATSLVIPQRSEAPWNEPAHQPLMTRVETLPVPRQDESLPVQAAESSGYITSYANGRPIPANQPTRAAEKMPLTLSVPNVRQVGGISQYDTVGQTRSEPKDSPIARAGDKRISRDMRTLEPATKRPYPGPRRPSGTPSPGPSNLLKSILRQMEAWSSQTGQSNEPLRQRYELLEHALADGDWWYVILHCLYSQRQFSQGSFFEGLQTAGFEQEAQQIDASLEMLVPLFLNNEGLDKQHWQWLSVFPAQTIAQLRSSTPSSSFNEVMAFLIVFASYWAHWLVKTSQRAYPMMIYEFQQMNCNSPRMQKVLLTHIAQNLGAMSGLPELRHELEEDRAFESAALNLSIGNEARSQGRCGRATSYRNIVYAYRSQYHTHIDSSTGHQIPHRSQDRTEQGILSQHPLGFQNERDASAPASASQHEQHWVLQSQPYQGQAQTPNQAPTQHSSHQQQLGGVQVPSELVSQQYQHLARQVQQPQHQAAQESWAFGTWSAPSSQGQSVYQPQEPINQTSSDAHELPQRSSQLQGTESYLGVSAVSASLLTTNPSLLSYPGTQISAGPHTTFSPRTSSSSPIASQARIPIEHNQSYQGNDFQGFGFLTPVPAPTAPIQNQQRQPATTDPPRQNPFCIIPPTKYPDNTWNWTSLETGLQLVRERSPIREPREPSNSRFYQFVSSYAAWKTITPRVGLETVDVDIGDFTFESLTTMQIRHGQERCLYWEGSLRARLRLCLYPQNATDFESTEAPVAATYWPANIHLSLNGTHLQLRRKPHFRTDWPVELTTLLQKGRNTIVVRLPEPSRPRREVQRYLLMVEIVKTSSAGALKGLIHQSDHFTYQDTKTELQRRLMGSQDDEIVIQDSHLSVSVADPFSSTLCVTPVRSIHCKHSECFDLDNWLETRPSKPSRRPYEPSKVDEWKCPICGGDARPHQLRVDDFFVEVTRKLLADGAGRTKMIQMNDEGNWSAVVETDDSEDEDNMNAAGDSTTTASRKILQTGQRRNRTGQPVIILDDGD